MPLSPRFIVLMLVAGILCALAALYSAQKVKPAAVAAEPALNLPDEAGADLFAPPGPHRPVLLSLGAASSRPTRIMDLILKDLKPAHADHFRVVFMDVQKHPDIAAKYRIERIPVQLFLGAEGQELLRHEGLLYADDILNAWRKLGVKVESAAATDNPVNNSAP